MLEAVELRVLSWIDDTMYSFAAMAEASSKLLAGELDEVGKVKLRELLYKRSQAHLDIAKHYIFFLKQRTFALEDRDLRRYCAAVYGLTQDWRKVMDDVQWFKWGGDAAVGAPALQAVTVLVAALPRLSHEKLVELTRVFAFGEEEAIIRSAVEKGLVQLEGEHYDIGPKAPTPEPQW